MSTDRNTAQPREVIGDIRILFSFVIVPHFLIFVGLIALGAMKPQLTLTNSTWIPDLTFGVLLFYSFIVGLLFSTYLFAQSSTQMLTTRLLSAELAFLTIALVAGSRLLSLPILGGVFVPISVAILVLSYLPLSLSHLSRVLTPSIFILIILSLWSWIDLGIGPWLVGPALCALSTSVLVGNRILRPLSGVSRQWASGSESVDESSRDISSEGLTEFLFHSMVAEFRWRFLPLCVVVGAASLLFGLSHPEAPPSYYAIWVIVLAVQAILFYQATWQRTLLDLQTLWFLSGCGLFSWWMHSFAFGYIDFSTSEVGLLLIILGLATVPWAWQFNIALTAIFAALATMHIVGSESPILMFAIDAFLIVYVMCRNAGHFVRFVGNTLLSKYLLLVRVARIPRVIAESFGETLNLLLDSNSALTIVGSNQGYLIGSKLLEPDPVDQHLLAGIVAKIRQQRRAIGILDAASFEKQYGPAFHSWFGKLPRSFVYCRTQPKIGGEQESLLALLPVSATVRLVEWRIVEEQISSLIEITESGGEIGKSSPRISQVVIAPNRSMHTREDDLNDVIHFVNNAAQDLSIVSDNVRGAVRGLERPTDNFEDQAKNIQALTRQLKNDVDYLEGALRSLSTSVSDIKWLREAAVTKKTNNQEHVLIAAVIDEIVTFASYRLRRMGAEVVPPSDFDQSIQVSVASREFLEASLRALIRVATRSFGCDDQLRLKVEVSSEVVQLQVFFNGPRRSNLQEMFTSSRDEETLRAIQNFINMSSAQLSLERTLGPESNMLVLILKRVQGSTQTKELRQGWVLLVDDKPEIVTFYGSVAEALGLPFGSAGTLTSARELVSTKGEPVLVVSDIQLEQENGLDLVRELRDSFGPTLPIIVVSGNLEDNAREQVFSAGASRYLTKPVGRRKLFFEIKQLLEQ